MLTYYAIVIDSDKTLYDVIFTSYDEALEETRKPGFSKDEVHIQAVYVAT